MGNVLLGPIPCGSSDGRMETMAGADSSRQPRLGSETLTDAGDGGGVAEVVITQEVVAFSLAHVGVYVGESPGGAEQILGKFHLPFVVGRAGVAGAMGSQGSPRPVRLH